MTVLIPKNRAINNISHETSKTNETAFEKNGNETSFKKNGNLEDKDLMKKTGVFDRDMRMNKDAKLCGNGKHYCSHPFNYPYRY